MFNKTLQQAIQIIAIIFVIIQVGYLFSAYVTYSRFTIIHVGVAGIIVLLKGILNSKRKISKLLLSIVCISGFISFIYIYNQAERLESSFGMGLPTIDFFIGAIVLFFFLIACYLAWGIVVPTVMGLSILYIFLGQYIPGALGFPTIGNENAMTYLVMGISGGIFGYLIPISASVIFYFMIFGGIMGSVGVLDMFIELGKFLGRLFRGGAALTSLVGSTLMGAVSGSAMANVALTGAYTIPTMKSQKFSPQSAAAIEQVASSGGQIIPPIMGTAAFLMAAIIGVPYWDIVLKAIIPSIMFIIIALIGIFILIRHYNIKPGVELVDMEFLLSRLPIFVIPLGSLIFIISRGGSPGYAICYAIFITTALAILYFTLGRMGVKYFRSGMQSSLKLYFQGVIQGAISGAEIAVAIVAISVIAQVAITTSLGPKLGFTIMSLSTYTPFTLILVMIAVMILGMGMPTAAAYTIGAIIMVPTLTMDMGMDVYSAHFFVFYFAVFAGITPPVASYAIVAARIAGCDFWSASLHGLRLALPLFLLPYAWMAEPQLLNLQEFSFSFFGMLLALILGGITISAVTFRHFIIKLSYWEWLLSFCSSIFTILYVIISNNNIFLIISILSFIVMVVMNFFRYRKDLNKSS